MTAIVVLFATVAKIKSEIIITAATINPVSSIDSLGRKLLK